MNRGSNFEQAAMPDTHCKNLAFSCDRFSWMPIGRKLRQHVTPKSNQLRFVFYEKTSLFRRTDHPVIRLASDHESTEIRVQIQRYLLTLTQSRSRQRSDIRMRRKTMVRINNCFFAAVKPRFSATSADDGTNVLSAGLGRSSEKVRETTLCHTEQM